MSTQHALRSLVALTGAAILTAAIAAPPTMADVAPDTGTPVATGLNNPRHLSFAPNGDLYIAESGAFTEGIPASACQTSQEFGTQCLNDSGSITLLSRKGTQSRVLTGLPSIVTEDEAVGPSAVALQGQTAYVALGLGGDTTKRDAFGEAASALGTLTAYPLSGNRASSLVADLAAHENSDPAGDGVDSNPVALTRDRDGWMVADAGGNDILRVSKSASLSTVAVLPPGTQIPVQSVPTGIVQGPDGAWYVSELTGFPFPAGAATIWRIDRQGNRTAYATGLTNVTDLAWANDQLYAVQIADNGLLAGPFGSLVKVSTTGAHEKVAGPWFAPYGVAIRDGNAYVTTCSVCAGGGQVVKMALG